MSAINHGGPAFPVPGTHSIHDQGMTLRQYAAIKLRVPQSGDAWLDDMIREARRLDATEEAMNAMLSGHFAHYGHENYWPRKEAADEAGGMADALLAARSAAAQPAEGGERACESCGAPTMHAGSKCYGCSQSADADGWIEWNGGYRPVQEGALVDVRHRDGCEFYSTKAGASVFAKNWKHLDDDTDIVAYRVVKAKP